MKIGIIGKVKHHYWDEVKLGVNNALQKYSADVVFYLPDKEDIDKQIEVFNNFIKEKFDAIAVAPSDPVKLTSLINQAIASGIHCITIDSDAPNSNRYFFIGVNNYLAGKIASEQLMMLLNYKGNVAISTGSLTALNAIEKINGFKDVISKYKNVKLITTLCDEEDENKAYNLVKELILKEEKVDGIFGVFAINGEATARAIKDAGKKDIKLVCFDITEKSIRFMNEDIIQVIVAQRPYIIGYRCIQLLHNIIKFGKESVLRTLPESKVIDTGIDVVTKNNLSSHREFLKKLGIQVRF